MEDKKTKNIKKRINKALGFISKYSKQVDDQHIKREIHSKFTQIKHYSHYEIFTNEEISHILSTIKDAETLILKNPPYLTVKRTAPHKKKLIGFKSKDDISDGKKRIAKKIARKNIDFSVLQSKLTEIKKSKKTTTLLEMDNLIYKNFKNDYARKILYESDFFQEERFFIVKQIFDYFNDLTKNDEIISKDDLSPSEIKQALHTSITKFIETYYKQPKELKTVLIPYEKTPIVEYTEVTQAMIDNDDDLKFLSKLFDEYKRDSKRRIYNYSLFAFLYYAYAIYVSFEHLHRSELLKALGVYLYKKDRDKPVLKQNHKSILQQHLIACKASQYEINIYLKNLADFINEANTRQKERYILAFLVGITNNFSGSKEYINFIKNVSSNKNLTKKKLPKPVNPIILPPEQLQIA